jgi:hypothetical protein
MKKKAKIVQLETFEKIKNSINSLQRALVEIQKERELKIKSKEFVEAIVKSLNIKIKEVLKEKRVIYHGFRRGS